jgi:hypothetical protein
MYPGARSDASLKRQSNDDNQVPPSPPFADQDRTTVRQAASKIDPKLHRLILMKIRLRDRHAVDTLLHPPVLSVRFCAVNAANIVKRPDLG